MEKVTFCPICGHRLEMRYTGERERPVCPNCGFVYYMNPAVAAGTLVEEEGKVLLIRRGVEPRKGYWGLPAGYVEADESADEAAVRETMEETGVQVEIDDLLGVYSFGQSISDRGVLILYSAHATSGAVAPHPGDDATEARFFTPAEVPSHDELAFYSHRLALSEWRRARAVYYREARAEDYNAILALSKQHGETLFCLPNDVNGHCHFTLAWDVNQLVGFTSISIHPTSQDVRLNQVFVAPSHRRWGIGSHLLHQSVAYVRQQGKGRIYAEVPASNTGLVVYLKAGFQVAGFMSHASPHRYPEDQPVLFLIFPAEGSSAS